MRVRAITVKPWRSDEPFSNRVPCARRPPADHSRVLGAGDQLREAQESKAYGGESCQVCQARPALG